MLSLIIAPCLLEAAIRLSRSQRDLDPMCETLAASDWRGCQLTGTLMLLEFGRTESSLRKEDFTIFSKVLADRKSGPRTPAGSEVPRGRRTGENTDGGSAQAGFITASLGQRNHSRATYVAISGAEVVHRCLSCVFAQKHRGSTAEPEIYLGTWVGLQ